ncbi:MAG: DUF1841 family protein [Pseudomonadota bacterium]
MIFGENRDELRAMYADAWQARKNNRVLSPLQAQIADVIEQHPEYQSLLENRQLDKDFTPEHGQSNPFLHMGLHLAITDQVKTDRPSGIRHEYQRLLKLSGDAHSAEHRILECLGQALWEAQRAGKPPDEQRYLEQIKRLS